MSPGEQTKASSPSRWGLRVSAGLVSPWVVVFLGTVGCGGGGFTAEADLPDGSVDAIDETVVIVGPRDSSAEGATREGAATCTTPTTLACGGTCADPTLPSHCGSCENVCPGPDAGAGHATCAVSAEGGGTCGLGCSGSTPLDCNGAALSHGERARAVTWIPVTYRNGAAP
jgi:hypothetical protein